MKLIICLIILLALIYYLKMMDYDEKFNQNNQIVRGSNFCNQFGGNYNACYDNGCTIMLNENGVPFCTHKFLHEDI